MRLAVTKHGDLPIPSRLYERLIAEARAAFPHECCGLLLGRFGRIQTLQPTANVHPDPSRHFEIDPHALIAAHKAARGAGPQVIGYYHSHPTGDPTPSPAPRMTGGFGRSSQAAKSAFSGMGKRDSWRFPTQSHRARQAAMTNRAPTDPTPLLSPVKQGRFSLPGLCVRCVRAMHAGGRG